MAGAFRSPPCSSRATSRREFLRQSGWLAAAGALLSAISLPGIAAELAIAAGKRRAAFGPPVWPPFENVESLLRTWAKKHPQRMTLEAVARSAQGRTVYAVQLTDPKAADSGKEHALITALHSGLERSATTTVLHIIEWLLSGDPRAEEILRRQRVVCMPVPDPDRYQAGQVSPVYGAWMLEGPRNPEKSPEALAVKQVMDRYQPEVHADIHGVDLSFERYIMFESSGSSYSNTALRPYHRDIIRQMDEAALAEGYPSDTAESDAERLFWGPDLDPMSEKVWPGRPRVYAAIYCYHHYHTLVSASEVAWERSGLLRHRRLLEIGNQTWPGEYYAGYPTRIVVSNTHAMLAAYGQNAAERRRSRVELWNKLDQLTFGILDPVVEGKATCVCATSSAAARKWLAAPSLQAVLAALRNHPGMNAEMLDRFAADWPAGQNAPQPFLALQGPAAGSRPADQSLQAPIRHGLCLRLRLPFGKARLLDLRLNGHPVPPSETDGFLSWTARGCTFLQVNLPPERLQRDDLFLVTCDYDPGEKRERWDSWRRADAPPG